MDVIARLAEWVLDVGARRPAGWIGRFIYGRLSGGEKEDRKVLEWLDLKADDRFFELGQGGGILLGWVLETAARAAAVDHSADMVELAKRRNRQAVEDGRLEIVQADAASLPWPDDSFTCGACLRTFLFFEEPEAVLREVGRVLRQGGRFVILTPARPEGRPMSGLASRYTAEEVDELLQDAGFVSVRVEVTAGRLLCYGEVEG